MKTILFGSIVGLAVGLAACGQEGRKEEAKPGTVKGGAPTAATEVAVIKTSEGELVVEFWPDVAPKTVENFKKLARQGFYDGTCFHRVIRGFMIQGGDPNTKDPGMEAHWGEGDPSKPGYTIKGEFSDRKHVRGILSMARKNDPDSADCQFFVCHGTAPHLDGKYAAFGKLIKGDEVLEKIATTPTGPNDRPVKRMNIDSIKIVAADSVK